MRRDRRHYEKDYTTRELMVRKALAKSRVVLLPQFKLKLDNK